MKQIIVMVSMVVLGIFIAGMVNEFGTNADTLAAAANTKITAYTTEVSE